ncbi:MAG: hypothetical protein V9G63_10850 [Candidatus Competibacter sp.]
MDSEGINDSLSQPYQPQPAEKGACCNGLNDEASRLSYVYALGRIEPRCPYPSVEKELAQAIGRAATAGLTDPQALHAVLSERQNRYLVRQLCWVLSIEGLETYILKPRDPTDHDLLVTAIRPAPSPMDIDAVIGVRGPIAPPELCNGLMVPVVFFDQIYSFDHEALIDSIPRPEKTTADQFDKAAAQVLDGIMQWADNAGATDEHRALNYLALRYSAIYHKVMEQFQKGFGLKEVEIQRSRLSGTRNIVDVIFAFNDRRTDFIEKFFVRVDVTEEFPFLVTKLSPYYNR